MRAKHKPQQTFPVMDGAREAPRADQIAGIVQRVWADSHLYGDDVEPLLRNWLTATGCIVQDDEFKALLIKAQGEFVRISAQDAGDAPRCPVGDLVSCLYWDVQQFETGPGRAGPALA